MNNLIEAIHQSIASGRFIQLVLSRPSAGSPVSDAASQPVTVEKLVTRLVTLKTGLCVQFTERVGRQEVHRNMAIDEAVAEIAIRAESEFLNAHLFTAEFDLSARRQPNGRVKIVRSKPSKAVPTTSHDRLKQYLIPEGQPCEFLHAIGVMTAEGRVHAAKQAKFRQINRFLEFIQDIYADLPSDRALRVVDFGCGKSYLTFALHHLLSEVHRREVDIVGLDLKATVIEDCRRIAERLSCRGLRFETADIAGFDPGGDVDMSVSLHACDTATDVAIAQAIRWNAAVILSVPCCHHEFAQQIESDKLRPVLKHGILRERLAELLTDAARAAVLEQHGYRAQVVEFIETEHTPKNLLIRAVRRGRALASAPSDGQPVRQLEPSSGSATSSLDDGMAGLLRECGIERFTLNDLLSETGRDAHN